MDRPHLFPGKTGQNKDYVYPGRGGEPTLRLPEGVSRVQHGQRLKSEVEGGVRESTNSSPAAAKAKGTVLLFESNEGLKLALKSLERRPSGIELLNSRVIDDVMTATVFIPEGKESIFLNAFERYCYEDDTRTGKPKAKKLAESINRIRLATIRSFWTDNHDIPADSDVRDFEVWIRRSGDGRDADVADFKSRADRAGIAATHRNIVFPERIILLAKTSLQQLTQVEGLFDILAELRLARIAISEFLNLAPRDQTEFINELRDRTTAPPDTAPSVCHLDTGIQAGHPLLEVAIDTQHVLHVLPHPTGADVDGHGTEMAGLALYGCLNEQLNLSDPVVLGHRLESVKIFSRLRANDPDLYGEITSQAMSMIEIAVTRVQRAFCLTVTSVDGRDEGLPSSWSAALDGLCVGAESEDAPRRLVCVSAGNIEPLNERREYPAVNALRPVKDPNQAWNAISVGAMTQKTTIYDPVVQHWKTIAAADSLSPSSRTSTVWKNTWPFKPDIVMEGGNNAINPANGKADFLDDLSLLTTRMANGEAQLTTTGDTSAATALASRYAALIWSQYPALWPETVRALLIHSARWTDKMMEEYPDRKVARLRTYGYGVPDLGKALSSVGNAATMVVEEALRPFHKVGTEIKTKHMHLHELPWPNSVLAQLFDADVSMRVTLSYFIEPNPGERGWTRKHRYRSHGLRFDVKRPGESMTEFQARISADAQDDDDDDTSHADEQEWELGSWYRNKGSIHSDTWTGTAADLASSGVLAVYPVSGWWKERKHLNGWEKDARYSLIISLETASEEADFYTEIEQKIKPVIETEIEM
ncbi:MAG: S8 family peptidase [Planctomycetaceae bacterium]|nr:S8 family peptidase [Planctomycetales bacterium]MCB9924949.1 S8 family peptidase [Planctomycetaceae bacterium]